MLVHICGIKNHIHYYNLSLDEESIKGETLAPGMMVYAFNPSTREAEAGRSLGLQASLVYILNSMPVRTIYRARLNNKT